MPKFGIGAVQGKRGRSMKRPVFLTYHYTGGSRKTYCCTTYGKDFLIRSDPAPYSMRWRFRRICANKEAAVDLIRFFDGECSLSAIDFHYREKANGKRTVNVVPTPLMLATSILAPHISA